MLQEAIEKGEWDRVTVSIATPDRATHNALVQTLRRLVNEAKRTHPEDQDASDEDLRFTLLADPEKPREGPGYTLFAARETILQRRIIMALPHEISHEAMETALANWCERELGAHGINYHAVIHRPEPGNDDRNYHAHVVFCPMGIERSDDEDGAARWTFEDPSPVPNTPRVVERVAILTGNAPSEIGDKKENAKFRRQASRDLLKEMRASWCNECNSALAAAGEAKRYNPTSYAAQGRETAPGRHRGPTQTHADPRYAKGSAALTVPEWEQAMEVLVDAAGADGPKARETCRETLDCVRLLAGWAMLEKPPPMAASRALADTIDWDSLPEAIRTDVARFLRRACAERGHELAESWGGMAQRLEAWAGDGEPPEVGKPEDAKLPEAVAVATPMELTELALWLTQQWELTRTLDGWSRARRAGELLTEAKARWATEATDREWSATLGALSRAPQWRKQGKIVETIRAEATAMESATTGWRRWADEVIARGDAEGAARLLERLNASGLTSLDEILDDGTHGRMESLADRATTTKEPKPIESLLEHRTAESFEAAVEAWCQEHRAEYVRATSISQDEIDATIDGYRRTINVREALDAGRANATATALLQAIADGRRPEDAMGLPAEELAEVHRRFPAKPAANAEDPPEYPEQLSEAMLGYLSSANAGNAIKWIAVEPRAWRRGAIPNAADNAETKINEWVTEAWATFGNGSTRERRNPQLMAKLPTRATETVMALRYVAENETAGATLTSRDEAARLADAIAAAATAEAEAESWMVRTIGEISERTEGLRTERLTARDRSTLKAIHDDPTRRRYLSPRWNSRLELLFGNPADVRSRLQTVLHRTRTSEREDT